MQLVQVETGVTTSEGGVGLVDSAREENKARAVAENLPKSRANPAWWACALLIPLIENRTPVLRRHTPGRRPGPVFVASGGVITKARDQA